MSSLAATAVAAPAPVPAAEALARVHAVLDEVASGGVVGPVTGGDLASVDRAISRMQSMKLQMVAAADRERVAESSGMSGTAPWLAVHTRTGGAEAAGTVGLAVALDASLPATRAALSAGDVSTEHAAIISGTVSRLPEGLSREERARVEAALVAKARRLDPPRLRRAARRALEAAERTAAEVAAHEDAELRGEEERAAARVRLTMHDNRDGTVSGSFTVPALAGAILRKVVQQIASPRRNRSDAGEGGDSRGRGHPRRPSGRAGLVPSATVGAGAGGASERGSVQPLDWARRHGEAFVEILEHLPTDRLPGRSAANVVVTVDLEELRAGVGVAHLDTGHDLSAAQARRLACTAGIIPAVLGGASVPLDLGRTARFFSARQQTALATVYDECAADGCDRPYAWCDLHHEEPWASGGATDLHLAVPLCGWHHRRVHDPKYEHAITDVGGRKHVVFHRRGDPRHEETVADPGGHDAVAFHRRGDPRHQNPVADAGGRDDVVFHRRT